MSIKITHHFIQRLNERFAKLMEDVEAADVMDMIQQVVENHNAPLPLQGGRIAVKMNFRVCDDDKYTTHKLNIITDKNKTVLITVLTDTQMQSTLNGIVEHNKKITSTKKTRLITRRNRKFIR
jgi:hypothetical protein